MQGSNLKVMLMVGLHNFNFAGKCMVIFSPLLNFICNLINMLTYINGGGHCNEFLLSAVV